MSKELRNIKLFQLFNLELEEFERYFNVLKALKPMKEVAGYEALEITSLSFSDVSDIRHKSGSEEVDDLFFVFKKVFNVSRSQFYDLTTVEFFHAFNYIVQQIHEINEREEFLKSDPDPLMEQAGADRLNKFKEMNALIALGKQYGKSPEEVAKWSYSLVFTLLFHTKESNEVQNKYSELKMKQK